jgi:hypothetical protein
MMRRQRIVKEENKPTRKARTHAIPPLTPLLKRVEKPG